MIAACLPKNLSRIKGTLSHIAFGLTVMTNINAQEIEWQNTIGGSGGDWLYYLQQTADGGYILGGSSESSISGDKTENTNGIEDYWIVKCDIAGNIEWQNTIGGSFDDYFCCIKQTPDGGYILGGYSASNNSGDKTENSNGVLDYWILKTDSIGSIQWQNTIGGSQDDRLYSLLQTNDGGYILGGASFSDVSGDKTENSMGGHDYWIVKTDASGNIQWQNTIGGNSSDYLISIYQTADGGYILGGSSESGISGDKIEASHGLWDYWIVKTDFAGNIQWQNTIGGSSNDYLYSIHQTVDGGYILGGCSASGISGDKTEFSKGGMDYWVVKTDDSGNIQWQNTIGGNDHDLLYSLKNTPDGGYILGGRSSSNVSDDKTESNMGSANTYDYWVVKIDSTGNIQWQNTIGGNNDDWLYSIEKTVDGGYILGGYSQSNISGDKTQNSNGVQDYWIVKICDSLVTVSSCNFVSIGEIEASNGQLEVFPNPTKDELTIQLNHTHHHQPITFSVYDILGNEILKKQSATINCKLPTVNFSPGLYFVEVKTGKEVYRAKFVKE